MWMDEKSIGMLLPLLCYLEQDFMFLFLTHIHIRAMTENNLFQEVQEDLERQKLEAMWKQYGGWVVAFALAIVLVTAGMTAYRSWKAEADQRVTSGLLAASEPGRMSPKTSPRCKPSPTKNPGTNQSAFALLKAGAIAADQNDKTKAAQLFRRLRRPMPKPMMRSVSSALFFPCRCRWIAVMHAALVCASAAFDRRTCAVAFFRA